MKCAVHSDVDAVGYCRNCGKAMCSTCVRPVRDVLYCEECLANIVGIPGATSAGASVTAAPAPGILPPPIPARSPSSPSIAFILGFLFPGLGAVYNGEYNKALIQLVVFATFIFGLSSNIDDAMKAVLGILLAGFIFYMAFDSMRVAQARQSGAASTDPFEAWSTNRPIGPIILIAVGALLLLRNFDWFPWYRLSQFFWPAVLIGAGVLMMRKRLDRRS
jgi:TM2 domain-containing membrane protein YozV